MNNKRKRRLIDICLILIVLILVGSGLVLFKESKEAYAIKKEDEEIKTIVKQNTNIEKGFDRDTFNALKEINDDLIGYIEFESGIIAQPILKGDNNEQYLRKSFNGNNSSQGSIFMDYQYSFDDQNPIVYGHNVLYDNTAKFSPLAKLLNQEFYDKNYRFKIYTENEIRNYLITDVYVFDTEEFESFNYIKPNFEDKDDFDNWYSVVRELNVIQSVNTNINANSKMITLQTCKSLNGPERIIVLAVLDSVENY